MKNNVGFSAKVDIAWQENLVEPAENGNRTVGIGFGWDAGMCISTPKSGAAKDW